MISIGGELNLSFVYSVTMQDEMTGELWNDIANQVETQSRRRRSGTNLVGNEYGLHTVPTGSIFLMFHF